VRLIDAESGVVETASVKVDKATATDGDWPMSTGVDQDITDAAG